MPADFLTSRWTKVPLRSRGFCLRALLGTQIRQMSPFRNSQRQTAEHASRKLSDNQRDGFHDAPQLQPGMLHRLPSDPQDASDTAS
jgi:hypothetical protein